MKILAALCASLLEAIPETEAPLRAQVRSAQTSLPYTPPECEGDIWHRLARALRSVQPPGEWQERVFQLYSEASAARSREQGARV
jgi:hypothetical protein